MSRVAKNALFTAPKVPGIYMPANRFMENPILFARFSDMNPHEESLFGWADEYGRGDFIFSPHEPKDEREWRLERLDLSFAVMLWEMILKDDTKLNGIIEWNEDERRAYVRPFPRDKLDAIDFGREKDERYYPHYVLPRREIQNYRPETFDAKTAAARYIGQEICRKTREFPLTVRFETDERKEVHTIIEPTGLLSAMWYQFSLACTGEVKLRRCIICGMWENMERHRHTWSAHPNCANYRRVKRARRKKREGQRP